MLDRSVFYARLSVCKECEFWKGSCLKGHALNGDQGCPVLKFDGINGTGNLTDMPVPKPELPAISGLGCCGGSKEVELKPLSWSQVLKQFAQSMQEWEKSGFLMVSRQVYAKRLETCRNCKNYQWFQCRKCKCVTLLKAKLATEECPDSLWPM